MGSVPIVPGTPESKTIALPLVYSLLSSKEEVQYRTVFESVSSAAENYGVDLNPSRINSDFEVAIINSAKDIFPDANIQLCFFHLKQSAYRKVQQLGLVRAYQDRNDSSVRDFIHMMCSLAYVPVNDVARAFRILKEKAPENPQIEEFVDYFGRTYVIGVPAQGRRQAVAPRYHPLLWNVYLAALEGKAATNNAEEGWHNRFAQMVGRNHPDLYTLLDELKKEQGDTQISILEHKMGRKVKCAPKKKWVDAHEQLRGTVGTYATYGIRRVFEYLKLVSHNVTLE